MKPAWLQLFGYLTCKMTFVSQMWSMKGNWNSENFRNLFSHGGISINLKINMQGVTANLKGYLNLVVH